MLVMDQLPPALMESFTTLENWSTHIRSPGGSVITDGQVAALRMPGRPEFGAADAAGPGYASELEFKGAFLYGKFEASVRFSTCASHEEVVNGVFTYAHGGDHNQNGLTDNSEIDIEYLCGTPHILWLTTYTDFDEFAPGRLRKLSKKIDMRTGEFEVYADWPPTLTERGVIPGLSLPDFPREREFYQLGFEWREDEVRYSIRLDGRELDLFVIRDKDRIPHNPSKFLLNIWHSSSHWTDGAEADYPAQMSDMLVDWVRISP